MFITAKNSLFGAIATAGLLVGMAGSGQAAFLPNVANLNFIDYTGAAPKNSFTAVNPVGWTGGTGLIYVDAPGTATSPSGGIPVYGPFADPPIAGNFVQADGNPTYESGFQQEITGLTPGTTYTLSFYQAGGSRPGLPAACRRLSNGSSPWAHPAWSSRPPVARSIRFTAQPAATRTLILTPVSRYRRT